jgi:hypothetical protein
MSTDKLKASISNVLSHNNTQAQHIATATATAQPAPVPVQISIPGNASTTTSTSDRFKAILHINDTTATDSVKKSSSSTSDDTSTLSDDRCGLSRKQRIIGFAACFILGWFLSILSLFSIGTIVINPTKFAVLYTVGNLISLMGTLFLFGPLRQIKSMFAPIRVGATIVFLAAMGTTLGLAFGIHPPPVIGIVIVMIIQLCAAIWYTASYFPYGREILMKAIGGCFRLK